jgi:hypothetical protein
MVQLPLELGLQLRLCNSDFSQIIQLNTRMSGGITNCLYIESSKKDHASAVSNQAKGRNGTRSLGRDSFNLLELVACLGVENDGNDREGNKGSSTD